MELLARVVLAFVVGLLIGTVALAAASGDLGSHVTVTQNSTQFSTLTVTKTFTTTFLQSGSIVTVTSTTTSTERVNLTTFTAGPAVLTSTVPPSSNTTTIGASNVASGVSAPSLAVGQSRSDPYLIVGGLALSGVVFYGISGEEEYCRLEHHGDEPISIASEDSSPCVTGMIPSVK